MKSLRVHKPTVLIFKETLLPISETFIDAQTRQLTQFIPRYIGLGRVTPSLAVPDSSILLTRGRSLSAQLRQKLYRRVAIAPNFHRRAAESSPSLIHAHFASGGRSALPLARHLKIPLVVTLHGSDVTTRMDFRRRYKELWDNTSVFLCVSEFIKHKAEQAGFPQDKLRVHYIGIDANAFLPGSPTPRRNVVLFVGRLVEKKGCEVLLRAMAEVKKKHSEFQTVVIGDGPLRHTLEEFARRLDIPCQFLGSQPADIVRHWMKCARVFCVPSVTASNGDCEGLPIVLLEAQAVGTPVVATLHAGIPEVLVDGETGLLTPERDCDKLAFNIRRLIEDGQLWSRCSQRGPEWVRDRFDVKSQTRELVRIYGEVCPSMGFENDFLGIEAIQTVAQFVPAVKTYPCHDSA